jgi:hypothetical protein
MKKQLSTLIKLVALIAFVSSCTKSRKAELPEEQKNSIFAISEFGTVSDDSPYSAQIRSDIKDENSLTPMSIENNTKALMTSNEVNVPSRMKFMFNDMPLMNLQNRQFKITFSVDREFVTAYKVTGEVDKLTMLEKVLAKTSKEVKLAQDLSKASSSQVNALNASKTTLAAERESIKAGRIKGSLLVPLFKYKIQSYGTVVKAKNELKEETSRLELKTTEWAQATHIQVSPQTDSREMVGMGVEQTRQLKQIFSQDKVDNQIMTSEELQQKLSVGMRFIEPADRVFTRLDANVLRVYQITDVKSLNANQLRLLRNKAGNNEILSCSDSSVAQHLRSEDEDCVLVLKADIPVNYKRAKLADVNENGSTAPRIEFESVSRNESVGLIEIQENVAAKQVDISGVLDPDSTIKLSDIQGEFFYRRTFESASNMFLGRTGTSGDMAIVKFELEDRRLVVRNQKSLIEYTGQGPKDREELMSFPVKYIRMVKTDASGATLTIPVPEQTTKEKAEYAVIDWTNNTVPDAVSPLAFYGGGNCFMANSSLAVTDTDMRLASDGVLNYSLSGSYTVKPDDSCVAASETNAAYWKGQYQFNFNIKERISFRKHTDKTQDEQFALNISPNAQAAFNYGVFTLADKVTGNGTLGNRNGSEKYMPIIHDLRNKKKLVYHLGGINNPEVTSPERRELLVEAAKQVIDEWNKVMKYSFRGTSLEREGTYVELVVDTPESEAHLGDLDRNYIWFQELSAENGLLGVAQPAANPRSGIIQASNVIVYTGNTFDQTEALLQLSKISREYEKSIEKVKEEALAAALKAKQKEEADAAAAAQGGATGANSISLKQGSSLQKISQVSNNLRNSVQMLQLDSAHIQSALQIYMTDKNLTQLTHAITSPTNVNAKTDLKNRLKQRGKGQKINIAVNEETFMKKLTELAMDKRLANNPFQFELEFNKAFIQYGGLSESVKEALQKRSQLISTALRFENQNKNRPGCFTYSRNEINDKAAILDADPRKNLMLNFKKAVMSTLSHELGHAFGLLHNFKGSTDKANYVFANEDSGGSEDGHRNYSSIMDYIGDVEMHYAGPGPYDEHAIRAAYTGMVELSEEAKNNKQLTSIIPVSRETLVKMTDVMKIIGQRSGVHLTKDSINQLGLLRHFEQCDDSGTLTSAMCARFDVGGSASEIVQNLIADYDRAYVNRNFVHDKINFGWTEKSQIINRNISTFRNIRSFLDEAFMSDFNGTGLRPDLAEALLADQVKAAKLGYEFFHRILRTPHIGESILRPVVPYDSSLPADSDENKLALKDKEYDSNGDGLVINEARFIPVGYKYKNDKGEEVQDIKVIEGRSLGDIAMKDIADNDSRDKMNTMGIAYDKIFSMMFLLQSTSLDSNDDSRDSSISYVDFEQYFMEIEKPTDSPIMKTVLQILTKTLKAGFFAPSEDVKSVGMVNTSMNIDITRMLGDQTAIATIVSLAENKWRNFDPFAEMFKVGKAFEASAPQDRFNVAKAGQKRGLSDTRVHFAAQNAIGSSILVNAAARNEVFVSNKEAVFALIKTIVDGDAKIQNAIFEKVAEACAADENSEACKAAQTKAEEDPSEWIMANPELVTAMGEANTAASELVKFLRKNNEKGVIMPKDLDAPNAQLNFENQVMMLRQIVGNQLSVLNEMKADLENTPKEQLQVKISMIVQALRQARQQNQKLEAIPLFAFGFEFVAKQTMASNIEMKNGQTIPLIALANMMMSINKLSGDLNHQQSVIEKLSNFSAIVDSDVVIQ